MPKHVTPPHAGPWLCVVSTEPGDNPQPELCRWYPNAAGEYAWEWWCDADCEGYVWWRLDEPEEYPCVTRVQPLPNFYVDWPRAVDRSKR